MFFRPEEDRLFSECIDDALFLEIQEVHVRHKDHRLAPLFVDPAVAVPPWGGAAAGCRVIQSRHVGMLDGLHRIIEIAVDRQFHRRFTVGAFSADHDGKLLVP